MKPTSRSNGEDAVLEKIAAMQAPYHAMGERLHALILRSAPALQPTVWYGMPGYAKDGKTACFFPRGQKIHDVRLHPGGEPRPRGGRAAPAH